MGYRVEYLKSLIPKDLDIDKEYRRKFVKSSCYLGNGVYEWSGIYATDTRELFLMGCLSREGIHYEEI